MQKNRMLELFYKRLIRMITRAVANVENILYQTKSLMDGRQALLKLVLS